MKEQKVVRSEQEQFEHLDYMSGCEVCNIGIIKEIDRRVDKGETINKATKAMEKDITDASGGIKLFTAGSIRSRYNRIKTPKSCTPRTTIRTDKNLSARNEHLKIDTTNKSVQELSVDEIKKELVILRTWGNKEEEILIEEANTVIDQFVAEQKMVELLKKQVKELQRLLLEYDKVPQQQNNQDFVEEFKEEREERIKKIRTLNGYNEDGTRIE